MKKRKPASGVEQDVPELVLERVIGLSPSSNSVAYSPSSSDIAYCAGCVVVIYDAKSNCQRMFLRATSSTKPFISVAYSVDGSTVAAGESGSQPAVVVWEAASGRCVAELKGHKHGVASISFSPSGKFLVSCGATYDGQICLWNWTSQALLTRERTQVELRSVTFSEDGSSVISVGKGHLRVWSVSQVGGGISRVGRATASQATVTLTGRSPVLGAYKTHTLVDVVASVGSSGGLSPPCFFAVSSQGVLMQMKTNSRGYDRSVDLKVRAAFTLAASQGVIAVGCADGIVRLFAARTLSFKATLPRPAAYGDHGLTDHRQSISAALRPNSASSFPDVLAASFDSTGDRIAVVYADHSLFVWDIRNMSKVGRFRSMIGHSGPIWDVSPLPSIHSAPGGLGKVPNTPPPGSFATASADGTVKIWNIGASSASSFCNSAQFWTRSDMWPENAYCKSLMGVFYTREATCVVEDGRNFHEDQPVGRKTSNQDVPVLRCLKASPDGQQLVAGDRKGNLRVFDVSSLKEIAVLEAHDNEVLSLDYSPCGIGGGFVLASGGRDHLVHVYDAQRDYKRLVTLDDHTAAVTSVRFANNGNRLLSCGADRGLVFRDLGENGDEAGDARRVQVPGRGPLYDMQLEITEKYLVTSGEDKKLKVYGVDNGKSVKSFSLPQTPGAEAVRMQVDPAGITLATSHSDRCIRLFDFYTGEILGKGTGHGDVVTGMFIASDCSRLVSVAGDSCVFVWRMPPKLVADSIARLATLPVQKPLGIAAHPHSGQASPLAHDRDVRSSKKGKLLESSSPEGTPEAQDRTEVLTKPTPPSDVESESLTSERLRAGKGLVSTRKLPKWAQAATMTGSTGPSPALDNETSAPSYMADGVSNLALVGKWSQRVDPTVALSAAERRRFSIEPAELSNNQLMDPATRARLDGEKPGSVGSYPELANAAEDDDEIIYYDEEDPQAAGDADGFEVVDPPPDLEDPPGEEDGVSQGACDDADREDEDAFSPSDELPRSNLFKEHFGQLLQDEPLPGPAPGSREAARQSFSSQFRAVCSADDNEPGFKDKKEERREGGEEEGGTGRGEAADMGGNGGGAIGSRKGRMNAEIKDMRARLVDLGLSLAEQQKLARRGNLVARGALHVGEPIGETNTHQEAENDAAAANLKSPKELFSVGAAPPDAAGRLTRTKSDVKRKQSPVGPGKVVISSNEKQAPPLPPGTAPLSAISLASTEFKEGQMKEMGEATAERQEAAVVPLTSLAEKSCIDMSATPSSTKVTSAMNATQYHNPTFDLTPDSTLKDTSSASTAASAMAALKCLQKERAAAKLMQPGHRTLAVVYSSQEGLSLQTGEKLPTQAVTADLRPSAPSVTSSPALGASPVEVRASQQCEATPVEGGDGETNEHVAEQEEKSKEAGPCCAEGARSSGGRRTGKKDLSALRGARVRGLGKSVDNSKQQTTLESSSAEPGSNPGLAPGPASSIAVGSPASAVEVTQPPHVAQPRVVVKERSPSEGLSEEMAGNDGCSLVNGAEQPTVPCDGNALEQLRMAVTGVESLHKQLGSGGYAKQATGGCDEAAFQAEVHKMIARLQALLVTPSSQPILNPPTTATPSPQSDLHAASPADAQALPPGWETPNMVTPSLSGSLSFNDISFQVGSMLEGSAEKFSEKYSELLAKKLEHKLQLSLQKLMGPKGSPS